MPEHVDAQATRPLVSIIIPVFNKIEFTALCLDRIWRHTGDDLAYEVVVVDNASSDGTAEWFAAPRVCPAPLVFHRSAENLGFAKGNNLGVGLSRGEFVLFLNNDTLVQPGWLHEMLRVARSRPAVGIVGIKQLFPYTNVVYHTGIVFAPGGVPQHLYPHLDATLPVVNQEREYQAVNGACLLISRALFDECGGFDNAYRNGYEDIELCMQVRARGRTVMCCTTASIFHYGQTSEGRTLDDDANSAVFASRWAHRVRVDQQEMLLSDRLFWDRHRTAPTSTMRRLADDCVYLADDLGHASAFTWMDVDLALALVELGAPVCLRADAGISPLVPRALRQRLDRLVLKASPIGGLQAKWSHYWPRHLDLELNGVTNVEFFAINNQFGKAGAEPWDYWLQSVRDNQHVKLPISEFCGNVLAQVGVAEQDRPVLHLGYSREVHEVAPPARRDGRFRFLTVSNSHDLERYGTLETLAAFEQAFRGRDDVALVVKDYGASSGNRTLRQRIKAVRGVQVEYVATFTDKADLIRLYKSCDAFVSAHRGEGFGMKILDAMACGLPVISTLFGGNTAYCTPTNSYPIDYSLVPVATGMDAAAWAMTNQPLWAEPHQASIAAQMLRVYHDPAAAAAIGQEARSQVVDRFTWNRVAERFLALAAERRTPRPMRPATPPAPEARAERSPYWLGLRVSVVIPTHNRKDKLLACLDGLAHQSVLAKEFEVIVVDDGSTDGTANALDPARYPYALTCLRQENAGPGTARNAGLRKALGELVLYLGDDIYADQHLLEAHLLAHAVHAAPGDAVLGYLDWPATFTPNAVMQYVCGESMRQFAYARIPYMAELDHRFFYTSNVSLKRQFLVDAADDGIEFDPAFRRAAFEDSELAYRLRPRGLRIHYAVNAVAVHDHWMDLESFAQREFGAGEMAVVFYRKHPGEDVHLQVRQVTELVAPAAVLCDQPDLLRRLEAFDAQTDVLLRSLAGSLEALSDLGAPPALGTTDAVSADRLRVTLHTVLGVIFDVERIRGKLQEWYRGVNDPSALKAAQTLGAVVRKMEFLNSDAGRTGPVQSAVGPLGGSVVTDLGGRLATIPGLHVPPTASTKRRWKARVRRFVVRPGIITRLLAADRYVETRLQASGQATLLIGYRRLKGRARRLLS